MNALAGCACCEPALVLSSPRMETQSTILIRPLAAADAQAFRALRLDALLRAPEAFGASHDEEAAQPLSFFETRLSPPPPSMVFGAYAEDALVGIAGFRKLESAKIRHKGTLWGLYISPAWRGHGIGEKLVTAVIDQARQHVVTLQAAVVATNRPAYLLYEKLGFTPYGLEARGLCVEGVFHDEALLAIELA